MAAVVRHRRANQREHFHVVQLLTQPSLQNVPHSLRDVRRVRAVVVVDGLSVTRFDIPHPRLHFLSAQTDVGSVADIVYAAGSTPNFVSGAMLDDSDIAAGSSKQLKIIGVSRDPENNDLTSANVVWRVVINESFFLDDSGI